MTRAYAIRCRTTELEGWVRSSTPTHGHLPVTYIGHALLLGNVESAIALIEQMRSDGMAAVVGALGDNSFAVHIVTVAKVEGLTQWQKPRVTPGPEVWPDPAGIGRIASLAL